MSIFDRRDSSLPDGFNYHVFISYQNADKLNSEKLYRRFLKYRIPEKLRKKYSTHTPLPKRLSPVYLDREESSASEDLNRHLLDKLRSSLRLVVVCSPNSVESDYVNMEIIEFKRMCPERKVLGYIVGGIPNASKDSLSDHPLESYPLPLRRKFNNKGQMTDEIIHPLGADARQGKFTERVAFIKLVAGLLDLDPDELLQRDKERQIKLFCIYSVIIILFAISIFGVISKYQAEKKQREQAALARALSNSNKGNEERGDKEFGNRADAVLPFFA